MAIIKNPITVIQGGGEAFGYEVVSVDNGDNTQTIEIYGEDAMITEMNLQTYKFQDIADVNLNGGKIATDAEYESAETYLQTLYNLILNGGSNE